DLRDAFRSPSGPRAQELRTVSGNRSGIEAQSGAEMVTETMTERAFVIFNPRAGGAEPAEVWRGLTHHFGPGDAGVVVHETAREEDPAATARAAAGRGYDVIVAAGGDGTVSKVANGVIGTPARLGIIPLGTANVLARELGIPIDPDAACRLLAGANDTAKIDG